MTSIELPFYFVLLAAFLLGAILCLLTLLWDRMRLSTRIVRANFRVQAMQNEERKLVAQMEKLAEQPKEGRLKLFFKREKKAEEEKPAAEAPKAEKQAEKESAASKDKPEVNEFFTETTPDDMDAAQATTPAQKANS